MEIFLCTLLVLAPVVKISTCCCYSRTSQLTSEIITTKKETGHDDCSLSDLTTNRSWWLNLQETGHDGCSLSDLSNECSNLQQTGHDGCSLQKTGPDSCSL